MKFTKGKRKNGSRDSNPGPLERDGQTDGRRLINCVDLTNYGEVREDIILIKPENVCVKSATDRFLVMLMQTKDITHHKIQYNWK